MLNKFKNTRFKTTVLVAIQLLIAALEERSSSVSEKRLSRDNIDLARRILASSLDRRDGDVGQER